MVRPTKRRACRQKVRRSKRGSMLVLIICITAVIVIPLFITICRIAPHMVYRGRAQNVVEAAALLAANDLSRIVINDPYFGYVSLSNYPAIGKATIARDGQALPVIGINTLIGTLRQNALIADHLHNQTMYSLVDQDMGAVQSTLKILSTKMDESLGNCSWKGRCVDLDGKPVDTLQDVQSFLEVNLPPNIKIESLTISLGWLQGGSDTTVNVPVPRQLAKVHTSDIEGGQYEAFTNYPVGNRAFAFAGLGSQSHLVSTRNFQEPDGRHFCSIIKLQCTLYSTNDTQHKIQTVVCSQPSSQPDQSKPGVMTVRFSGRPVAGLLSWNEFLSDGSFQDNKVTSYQIANGDYPYEKPSRMQELVGGPQTCTSQQFAKHLYYWLRNCRLRPRLDSILALINEPFLGGTNEVYAYKANDSGTINRKLLDGKQFTRAVIADGQLSTMADTKVKSGNSAIIVFRDNVSRLGTGSGKHAGQPLAGYPLGSSDPWTDHNLLALNFGQRQKSSDGLALDIEIGGTGTSTAMRDVISMRQRTRSRKI